MQCNTPSTGGWISFDNSVFPLTISIICFNIDTALSNNKGTNIVIVGVVLLHVKENFVINEKSALAFMSWL